METRKLVKTGADTYTVSIPKKWIKANNLKKGDLIFLKPNKNCLELSTTENVDREEVKEISFNVDKKNINYLRRATISAYINNYNVFRFHGTELNEKLDDIRKILQNFLALEVTEQTNSCLVARDYLNLNEFSIANTLRRMDMIARSMIIDLKNDDLTTLKSLEFRDYEVDKLYFLVSRLIRSILENPNNPHKLSSVETISVWWMAKNLENVADFVKKIAKEIDSKKKKTKQLQDTFLKIEEYYLKTMKAYFTNNKELANTIMGERDEINEMIINNKNTPESTIHMVQMVDHIRNIAKIMLDSVEDKNKK
ncbi:phosphate uptake regulator PhoU [Candidatus Woesearchaeota archaeon]|jgi:phosphate uptake regulator|nr:phosphate uptake regulator PhoU [Candidatus Woesearchaeota archaeon]MBT4387533.1 phosphate uptake regulator PhoU [Candidatus Woesearchaeota archaeon]MBT4595375.1 phosphate uptake regulator PhoU [Candidatus Woesearchaeota archaeon]MBT5741220.1 phosphate uptake regulator PhoU [Candidatus Woesearchaeota archaeon]MBT6505166.1 phosphate uptake regulator PhoU [Candidatus Woesearchaeota archaeon]